MKVLHVISGLTTGGAERLLAKLVVCLKESGHESVVACLGPRGGAADLIEAAGIPVRYLNPDLAHRFSGSLGAVTRLAALTREVKPDAIQGWMVHGNLAASLASVGTSVPVFWSIHQSVYSLRHEKPANALLILLGGLVARGFRRNPRAIVQVSRTGAAQHARLGYPLAKTEVIPVGFDTQTFHPFAEAEKTTVRKALGLDPEALWVGLVAREDPKKDVGNFIAAAALTAAAHPRARFLVLGRGWERPDHPMRLQAQRLGVEALFRFQGETAEAPRWMASLDVLVSASFTEAFPNVIGEAMACGVPCVVTDVGDSAWLLGDAGCVVPPREPHALSRGIGELLAFSPAERAERGMRGRARILENFRIEAIAEDYLALYRDGIDAAIPR